MLDIIHFPIFSILTNVKLYLILICFSMITSESELSLISPLSFFFVCGVFH